MIKTIKKLHRIEKLFSLLLILTLTLGCVLGSKQEVAAKTREIYATLMQKSNPFYHNTPENNLPVAYKVLDS